MIKANDKYSGMEKQVTDDIGRSVLLGKLDDMISWGRKKLNLAIWFWSLMLFC